MYMYTRAMAGFARFGRLLLSFSILITGASCSDIVPKGKLKAAARTCIPGFTDSLGAFEKLDASIRSQGLNLEIPGQVVGWKSQRVVGSGSGYSLKLLEHCRAGEAGLQLVFIEGSTVSFSLEGWVRWYAVNRTVEAVLEKQVVVEKHPWVNTPEDEDVLEFARLLDVPLPREAIETLVERGAGSEDELASIGNCRVIGDPADYPGC